MNNVKVTHKPKPAPVDSSEAIRMAAASLDGSRYVAWHRDNRVTVRNRAWHIDFEGYAEDRATFDAICVEHGIEPVKPPLKRR